jgi:hypothetical protein
MDGNRSSKTKTAVDINKNILCRLFINNLVYFTNGIIRIYRINIIIITVIITPCSTPPAAFTPS